MQLADRDSVWSGCYSLSLLYKFTSDMGGEGGFDVLGGGGECIRANATRRNIPYAIVLGGRFSTC